MSSIVWFPVFIQVSISISARDIISQVQETFTFEVFVLGGSSFAIPKNSPTWKTACFDLNFEPLQINSSSGDVDSLSTFQGRMTSLHVLASFS